MSGFTELYPDPCSLSPQPTAPSFFQAEDSCSPTFSAPTRSEPKPECDETPERGLLSRVWHWITGPITAILTISAQAERIRQLEANLRKSETERTQLVGFNVQIKKEKTDAESAFETLNKKYMVELSDLSKLKKESATLEEAKGRLEYELSLAIRERDAARTELENTKKMHDDYAERVLAEKEKSLQMKISKLEGEVQKQSLIMRSMETNLLHNEQKVTELQSKITGLLLTLQTFEHTRKLLDDSMKQEVVARTQLFDLLSKVAAERSSAPVK